MTDKMTYEIAKEITSDLRHGLALTHLALSFIEGYESRDAEIKRLREALENLIEPSECRFDHHGYCQEHRIEKPCSNQSAKEALKEGE